MRDEIENKKDKCVDREGSRVSWWRKKEARGDIDA